MWTATSPPALDGLIEALKVLPGVGPKSAQRMAFHLLQHDPQGARQLSLALLEAVDGLGHCQSCHTFTDAEICRVCADPQRDSSRICVVETPADQSAVERTGSYRGRYFVLMGRVSPLDGWSAQDIGLPVLLQRLQSPELTELIIATNFTAEGEATAHVIREAAKCRPEVTVTRLARGVPAGSELEHVDLSTIAHALAQRR